MKSTNGNLCSALRARATRARAALVSGCAVAALLAASCGSDDSGADTDGGSVITGMGGSLSGTAGGVGDAGVGGTTGGTTGGAAIGTAGGTAGGAAGGAVGGAAGGAAGGTTGGAAGGTTGGTGGGSDGGARGGGTADGGGVQDGGSTGGGSTTGGTGGTGGCAGATPISKSTCTAGESNCFSFFVASRARMFKLAQAFNGSTKGWGGDFRYGTPDGLTGADKLCTQIAEESLPGNCRTWRAFLTTSKVNAIDRVGSGPWYDRLNRKIATNLTELAKTRPGGITVSTILNNLPNEDGTPHHNEEASCTNLNSCADNHDVLTGSDSDGKACTASTCSGIGGMFGGGFPGGGGNITDWTCKDWTLGTSMSGIAPRCGHSWPTMTGATDDWISRLTENGCAPGFNLVQNGGPMATGNGSVGDGGGYGAIYCLALGE